MSKEDNIMRKCHANNLSNRKPCKRTDVTQYTTTDGVIREICTKHIEQINQGKTLTFHTEGVIPKTHTKEKAMTELELFPQSTGVHEIISDTRVKMNAIVNPAQEENTSMSEIQEKIAQINAKAKASQEVRNSDPNALITASTVVTLYSITKTGFRIVSGVKCFYWQKRSSVPMRNDEMLMGALRAHFQRHSNVKYVLARIQGRVECFKRDLTHSQMVNCSIRKSQFSL